MKSTNWVQFPLPCQISEKFILLNKFLSSMYCKIKNLMRKKNASVIQG